MNEPDLEKYKSAWKNEPGFDEKRLTRAEIQKFMNSESRSISMQFKTGIRIDIILKIIVGLSFAGILFLFPKMKTVIFLAGAIIILIASIVAYQLITYMRIPGIKADRNMAQLLKDYIGFYSEKYIKSLLAAALTGPMIFISGSLYYIYAKYGNLRPFDTEDYIVMCVFIVASYVIGAVAHVWNFSYRIRQLERSLAEIEQEKISKDSLNRYRRQRRRNVIILGIALLFGIILLFFLIFNSNN